jgi:hypothetical protein
VASSAATRAGELLLPSMLSPTTGPSARARSGWPSSTGLLDHPHDRLTMFHRAVAAPTGQAVASTRSRTPISRRDALAAEQILSDVLSHRVTVQFTSRIRRK